MNVAQYQEEILIGLNPQEYEILSIAMTLLDWSAIGNEKDPEKLKLIEQMKKDMTRIHFYEPLR